MGQTAQVLAGNPHVKDRLISLFDPDARPIRKGKLKTPTEFGYKVVVADEDRSFITEYQVVRGNPQDKDLWYQRCNATPSGSESFLRKWRWTVEWLRKPTTWRWRHLG